MRIIIDGMGGDNAPAAVVEGVVETSKLIDDTLVLVGDESRLKAELAKYKYDAGRIEVVHASEVVDNHDAPVTAIRRKKDSSMVVGINMVKNGEGDIFISAGNTGALMAGGLLLMGRLDGIDRPALASVYPVLGGQASLLVDAGANAECRAHNLLQFGVMGSIFMEKVWSRGNPRVSLANIGEEETKGSAMVKEAYGLLKGSNLNFAGNIEARDIPKGRTDVIVCDGFTGNIILKLTEGLAWNIMKLIKQKFTEGVTAKAAALLMIGKLKGLKKDVDYSSYGGAPILGVKYPLVKMHGSSGPAAVQSTIIKALPYAGTGVIAEIADAVSREMTKLRLDEAAVE